MCESLSAMLSSVASVSIDITVAIITGIYSGVIVAKYTEFRNLREESSRILQKGLTAKECSRELGLISTSLNRLGHKVSAKAVIIISNEYQRLSSANFIVGDDGRMSLLAKLGHPRK
ncbi:MAG: hypothetical protein NW204_11605 [Xanthomonadaceae bacterium]|nr:hypothetical protein [Xanthomonadaceae bacterium]